MNRHGLNTGGSAGCFGAFGNRNRGLTAGPSPDDEPSRRDVDRHIAAELNRLSMEEREKAMNDVHGVRDVKDEEPNLIQARLREMDSRLQSTKERTSYDIAFSMSPEYVSNQNFRLLFLRAAKYDGIAAAALMIEFFELKKELWGTEKLCTDITLDDFDQDDMEALMAGYCQICPLRDMAGRPIVVVLHKLRKLKVMRNSMRVQYYIWMTAMESPSAQKSGIVAIHYHVDHHWNNNMLVSQNNRVRNSLPIIYAGLHFCYDDPKMFYFASLCLNMMKTNDKIRYRPHFGSHLECLYEMTSYGIPLNALPISTSGELRTDAHRRWIVQRKELEASRINASSPMALVDFSTASTAPTSIKIKIPTSNPAKAQPGDKDVLFGRGKTVVYAPGNTKFRQMIDLYMQRYEAAGRLEKTCIADLIVRTVKDGNGGRFLKKEEGEDFWIEVDDATARKKVAHAFRNLRKSQKPQSFPHY